MKTAPKPQDHRPKAATSDEVKLNLRIVRRTFDSRTQNVFRPSDIARIFRENREPWGLQPSAGLKSVINGVLENTQLGRVILRSRAYGNVKLYTWGTASPFQIALALRPKAYLSHGTAMYLHGMTDQISRRIYVNQEQRPKPHRLELTQHGIHAAFSRDQRLSKMAFSYDDFTVVLINGKHTGQLEVGSVQGPSEEELKVTKPERTLIDIVVRPAYAGGVYQVLDAFKAARPWVSVNVLAATLKRLDYAYPYHQALGFYMEKAGYEASRVERFAKMGLKYDFYLAHGLKEKAYDSRWRLFYPKGF
jgi:predicted transcriptional regulator of viral defense system